MHLSIGKGELRKAGLPEVNKAREIELISADTRAVRIGIGLDGRPAPSTSAVGHERSFGGTARNVRSYGWSGHFGRNV